MANIKEDNTEVFSLLQPELLTEKQLREILVNRCVSRNLHNLNKKELVEIFRCVALPLPQREYTGTSWREKKFAKRQQRAKRTISFSKTHQSSSSSEPVEKAGRASLEGSSSSEASSRLKPPPQRLSQEKKVIKLSGESLKRRSSDVDLDKVVIKSKSKENSLGKDSSASAEKSESNGKQETSTCSEKKSSNVVKLKRDLMSNKDDKKEETKIEEEPTKKKRQKIVISW